MKLLLIPLDDSVLFPDMTATIAADVGDEERVLRAAARTTASSPRSARSPRCSRRARVPGAGRVATLAGLHRGVARRPPRPTPTARCASRSTRSEDSSPASERTRELEREYRAVVEEILELRGDDGRIPASCARSPSRARSPTPRATAPTLDARTRCALLETRRRHRAPRAGGRAAARAPRRASGPQAHPRRRRGRRRDPAARVLPAQADGVDPQGAGRGRRLRDRGVPRRRSRKPACPRTSREQARRSCAASSAAASSRARAR